MLYRFRRIAIATVAALATAASGHAGLIMNPSFELERPPGGVFTLVGTGAGLSAAESWTVFNNVSGTTTTELVPTTLSGGGSRMIHVTTTAERDGLVNVFLPVNTGPTSLFSSAWVFVNHGVVALGTGNGGNTGFDVFSTTIGQWELLQAPNGVSPANELIIYASSTGGADFFVDLVSVPEPATMVLLLCALGAAMRVRRR